MRNNYYEDEIEYIDEYYDDEICGEDDIEYVELDLNSLTQKIFAYDGCHKIYLIDNENQMNEAVSYNYSILPISELEYIYNRSCSLRFIDSWDLKTTYVKQFAEAVFKH